MAAVRLQRCARQPPWSSPRHQATATRASRLVARCSNSLVLSKHRQYRSIPINEAALLGGYDVPAPEDFYALLSLSSMDCPQEDIKAAYRRLQRSVHPDLVGPAAGPLAVVLNACYVTLMDDNLRAAYNFELQQYRKGVGSFDGRPVSLWMGDESETRAIFVAENECIGCGNCNRVAPDTFVLEEEHGRARVAKQWADDEVYVQEAVDSCPVDCIYYVGRSQLALLEHVMKTCKRENVGIMGRRRSGNMGPPPSTECPFNRAATYIRVRKDAQLEEVLNGRARAHDEVLAASIAKAWLGLPKEVRVKAWPEWSPLEYVAY